MEENKKKQEEVEEDVITDTSTTTSGDVANGVKTEYIKNVVPAFRPKKLEEESAVTSAGGFFDRVDLAGGRFVAYNSKTKVATLYEEDMTIVNHCRVTNSEWKACNEEVISFLGGYDECDS